MKKTVYIETSIPSYLTARPTRDVRAAAWQEITTEWWERDRHRFHSFISELVIVEASRGDDDAATRRLTCLAGIQELVLDDEVRQLAARLIADGGVPETAEADALHVAVATVHEIGLPADMELPPYRQCGNQAPDSLDLRRRRLQVSGDMHASGTHGARELVRCRRTRSSPKCGSTATPMRPNITIPWRKWSPT